MGVNKLWEILESCKKTLPLHHLQNKRLCIDLSCWIVQLHIVSRRHHINGDKPFLRGLFHRLRALIALNCTLILVADGSIPALKLSTYRKRLGSAGDNIEDEATSERKSLRRNLGSEFSRMIKDAKDLGISLGIPCLDGIEEAEAQCALLNFACLCDGCFTADSDVFLFGARTVYRDIYLGEGGYVVCYEMTDIESKLGFGRNSLITLALLLGGDYSQKVHGIGQETACQLVKSIGEKNILKQIISQGLAFAKKKDAGKSSDKSLISNVNTENKQCGDMKNIDERQNQKLDEHSQSVINAYLRPKCHSPESVEVQRALAQLPFQRGQLHMVCAQAFGWPPDKTDEYILPKIAERDLRRLANLRAISHDLGIQAPTPRLPVGYHVASVLKHRKLNGVECFEVSWGGEPTPRPSIVPASVLRSACPEMLSEFASKGAKKQNQCKARKQSGNEKVVLEEVETLLEDLVLHGERQGNDLNGADSCIIDLSTPSPPIHVHKHAACKSNILQVGVIDLSESDEEGPLTDHETRARELRTFLASIKEDLSK